MKRRSGILIALLCGLLFMQGCHNDKSPTLTAADISKVITQMSAVMIHDVTNPPLAARFFAYTCLAGYEVLAQNNRALPGMRGKLNGYPAILKPAQASGYDASLSSILCMMETSASLQPSGFLMAKYEEKLIDSCRRVGFSSSVIDSSLHYARQVSKMVLAYAKADKYNRISNYTRYTPPSKRGSWVPTPPAYMAPVEPYFNTIRPFTLDSASQFLPREPAQFSSDKRSLFYQYALLVYKEGGSGLTPEHRAIAGFWDCNPFAVENNGHMLIGLKKISPGAHWMGITGIACKQAKKSFSESMKIHAAVAIGLTDGFICCWDDKYRTNRIRPETAIRKYIDPAWRPLLQTPPFPEYISGHSVISAASAVILTHYFGTQFQYTDNVEEKFGIRPRHFSSFIQASDEAAMSRFWGGIHFKDAIEMGIIQGKSVGNLVLTKLK
ncbi:vanadium-dependent haloperoxidase [Mucilaginibacter psychrotolerans]|uniref:Phosphatase PAP2 family protein n=1 Tax=Mucilaginibacter psychrotolerans TaxID=1524096 RepID=A0A4Y8SKE2_9SPHI|nr:vanadium-dependent haloperoxidase [Mucilaginibacter psychrotolerans]TFF39322.1 phosphatase PAP2 family protein [Mucilaginibacter psychrotolerans]